MIPVPIIESIELEADGRATVWVKDTGLFTPVDRFRMVDNDPTTLEDQDSPHVTPDDGEDLYSEYRRWAT